MKINIILDYKNSKIYYDTSFNNTSFKRKVLLVNDNFKITKFEDKRYQIFDFSYVPKYIVEFLLDDEKVNFYEINDVDICNSGLNSEYLFSVSYKYVNNMVNSKLFGTESKNSWDELTLSEKDKEKVDIFIVEYIKTFNAYN